MYIGSLITKLDPNPASYQMGTSIPFPIAESEQGMKFSWNELLYTGVDLKFSFAEPVFCDTVLLTFASAPAYVEIISAENGTEKRCTKKLSGNESMEISVGVQAKDLIFRLHAALGDIVVSKYDIIGGIFDETPIYPTPDYEALGDTYTDLSGGVSFICDSDDGAFAAQWLASYVKTGGNYPIILCADEKVQEEAYVISVDAQSATITASERKGFLYAVSTLAQMIKDGKLRHGTITDSPFMGMRGTHFGIPTRENIPFFKRMVKNLLVPMRLNMMIIEVAAGMRYERHPEINEMWQIMREKSLSGEWPEFMHHLDMVCDGGFLEKEEIRELVDYIESFGIEVVPEVQSLSHVQYLTKCHPEIAEVAEDLNFDNITDLRLADIPTDDFYPGSYCPSNEKSYEIVFDVMEEILEVFKPKRYVHMGHDEVYRWGICPKCKQRKPEDILAQDVWKYRNFLAERGLKMMIWGDMVNDINWYAIPGAIDLLPKDVLLLDFIWYFKFDKDTEDRLLEHGFQVMMGNLYSSHYPRFESRIRKENMVGGQISTWVKVDEKTLSLEGKMFDFAYTAQMLWSANYSEYARTTYTKIITDKLPAIRSAITSEEGLPSRNGSFRPFHLASGGGSIPVELEAVLPQGDITLKGVPFTLAAPVTLSVPEVNDNSTESVKLALHNRADSLVFLYSTGRRAKRIAWRAMLPVGECTIHYTDGTETSFDLEYGYNIYHTGEKYGTPLAGGYYRHEGYSGTYAIDAALELKAADGTDVMIGSYEWVNPHPDREIATVVVRACGDTGVPIWLFGVTAVNRA